MPKASRGQKSSGGRPKNIATFKAASTHKEAYDYAKKEFNIRLDTNAMSIESANALNEAMFKVKQEFGTGAFGLIHHIGKVAKGTQSIVQGYYNPLTKGLAVRHLRKHNPQASWKATATRNKKNGHWSTDNELHTVYHELGHGIQHTLSKSQIQAIEKIRTSTMTKISQAQAQGKSSYKAQYLSRYGFTNTGEFIAESVAEYMNGHPRATAQAVIKVIKGN